MAATSVAAASPFLPERAVIVGRAGDGPWTDVATEARSDQHAELAVVVVGREGKRRVVAADRDLTKIVLGGRAVNPTERRDLDDMAVFGRIRVQWSTVEPHGFREGVAEN